MNDIITVSKHINAQCHSIQEAVQRAAPGSTIIVYPGVYHEMIRIDKHVEIIGDGPVDEIILAISDSNCIMMQTDYAVIRGFTIRQESGGDKAAVAIPCGQLVLENCDISAKAGAGISISGNANPLIHRCRIHEGQEAGIYVYDNGRGILEECQIFGHEHPNVEIAGGGNPIFRRCRIFHGKNAGIYAYEDGLGTFQECEIFGHVLAEAAISRGANPVFKNCRIHSGNDAGVFVVDNAQGTLEDCDIFGHRVCGVVIKQNGRALFRRCRIRDGEGIGVWVSENGFGTLEDCDISGHRGLGITVRDKESRLTIHRCRIEDKVDIVSSDSPQTESALTQNKDELETLLNELEHYIGLENVKQSIHDLIDYLQYVRDRKRLGVKTSDTISLHSIFLGNPGTGKTTIARLLGRIFKAMGLLEMGHVVEVDRPALIAEYVGQTAIKTEKIIHEAMGGVLFIDEAYTLAKHLTSNDYGQEAIDVILKRMEDSGGQFVVIAAGYPEEMQAFIESNPGLKDRFKNYFCFQDYTPDEMIRIAQMMAQKEEYTFSPQAEELLREEFICLYRKRDKFFGNARLVRKYIENIKIHHAKRCSKLLKEQRTREVMTTILAEDVEGILTSVPSKTVSIPINEKRLSELLEQLNRMIGLESVKKSVSELVKLVRYYKEEERDVTGKFSPHLLFLGNPGTGKTTVARLLSEIYAALGVLPKGHLVETSREELIGAWMGHTEEKMKKVIDEAIGGVLFIDEAYTLKPAFNHDYGQLAIDILLKRMEDERGKLVVIAAGYPEKMEQFIESNPGLRSRFSREIIFEDYDPDELMSITELMLIEQGYRLAEDVLEQLLKYYQDAYQNRGSNFGNGRLVRNIVEEAVKNATLRLAELPPGGRRHENAYVIHRSDIGFLKND
ncbi:right-handed parallel beta-helix repeat-containing protein [Effusibacillus consociatus]|uniref:Right-handed parallel beta-helix repeat-containing protein n=1 Tax=Effusibacillus consociatus TaxID=1117041 RepID=A0ABV9PYZ4_9BACL